MTELSKSELTKLLCPKLVPQILNCLDNAHHILQSCYANKISILNVNTSSPGIEKLGLCDRIMMSLPICSSFITWELLFDYTQIEQPPDFTFGDDFRPDILSLKYLEVYDIEQVDSLKLVIQELLQLYLKFNREKVLRRDRVGFELKCLLESGYSDVRVLAKEVPGSQSNGANTIFHFEIPLDIDMTRLPPSVILSEGDLISPSLLAIFKSHDYNKVVTKLIISPALSDFLKQLSGSSLSLQPWGDNWGNLLLDYVPKVKEKLERIVSMVSNSYQKKKELFNSLKERLNSSLLEYDVDQFTKAAFLIEEKGFFFIIHLTIKNSFPATQPVITMQSVYHFVQIHTPFHRVYQDYPYSPRWSGQELVHRILLFLHDALDQFKIASLQGGKLRL